MKKGRYLVFTAVMIFLSIALSLAAGEIMLRIIFSDKGAATSGGPGGEPFDYTLSPERKRGPSVNSPKRPGVTRILVQGDSLTYGQGVKRWTDLFPFRLLSRLNEHGERYEMETISRGGRNIDGHLKELKKVVGDLKPDMIIYQWYINDLEYGARRIKTPVMIWRKSPYHKRLLETSFLYFFLDNRLGVLIGSYGQTYPDYLKENYGFGTANWTRFREYFHRWAVYAKSQAKRIIVLLYPVLPYAGDVYPLQEFHDMMRKIAGPDVFAYGPSYLPKTTGEDVEDQTATYGVARKAVGGKTPPGYLAFGPYIPFLKGDHEVTFRIKVGSEAHGPIALIDAVAGNGAVTLAMKKIMGEDFGKAGVWREFKLSFRTEEEITNGVEFRLNYMGGADLSLDSVSFPTDYGIEVVDATPRLTGFNTHASLFDAHPNARAHGVMADVLYEKIIGGKG